MSNKSIVLMDLDGVVAKLHKKVAETFNTDYRTHLDENSFSHYSPSKGLEVPCSDRDYISRVVKGYLAEPHFYLDLEVVEGAQDGVQWIVDAGMEVIILSSYGDVPACVPDKAAWLDKHFPMLERHNRIFTGKKSLVYGDYFIDDSPTHLAEWAARHPKGKTATLALPYTRLEHAAIFASDWDALAWRIAGT